MKHKKKLQCLVLALQLLQSPAFSPTCVHRRNLLHRDVAISRNRRFSLWYQPQDQTEANLIQDIRKCQSIYDIDCLLIDNGPHAAAAALRRITDLTARASDVDRNIAREQIPVLLETVGQEVILDINNESFVLNLYALSDILISLSRLGEASSMSPLASQVCNLMDRYNDKLVKTLGPRRLVECLKAITALQLVNHEALVERMCNRLCQGDALSLLGARHLSMGLIALASIKQESTTKAFLRRWRKQAVRQHATVHDICGALYAARCFSADDEALFEESEVMVHTLFRELYRPSPDCTLPRSLTARQVAQVLSTASTFEVNVTHPIFDHVMTNLSQEGTMERCTLADKSKILFTMKKLRVTQYPFAVEKLGFRFLELIQEDPSAATPTTVNNILRCALLLHRKEQHVMDPYLRVAKLLFLRNSPDGTSFLSASSNEELSNFVWFLSRAHCNDEDLMVALAECILERESVDSFSPKHSCRILTCFTIMVEWMQEAETSQFRLLLTELFHSLGTHLLSSKLTPAETTAALQAYAKASYVQDMGIFDHLAKHLSSLLDECSIRQVSQGLKACGKMMLWETDHPDEAASGPPYLSSAKKCASFLASRATHLTAKDVSQSMWACGRLGITDLKIVCALAYQARQLAHTLSSQEVASTLWGLAKVGHDDQEVVSTLTKRMTWSDLQPSAQDAATTLYALGVLEIRDEDVFVSMNDIMMDQLETASAQAIANALWAYRAVHVTPPQELLDSWAIQKLGLTGIQPQRIEDLH